ncbi:MAG TPA: PaaI family thioesterase [Kofleriaceae bacterium]|nr:PaaI family thioesterase [Kofleriaceae bacterium]
MGTTDGRTEGETDPATHRYGVASREETAGLTGKEILERIADGRFPQPPISRTMSFRLVEVGDGFAVFEGDPGDHLLNPMGTVHGGWALTIIDSVTGCAAHTLLPAGAGYTTVETRANFVRPIMAATGRVRAEGRVVAHGRQIITAEAKLTGPDGKLLSHGTSTLLVLGGR